MYFKKKKILVFSNDNDNLQKEHEDLKNTNDSLKGNVKCLEKDNDILQNEIISFKEKINISLEHESLMICNLTKEKKALKKKSNELDDIVLKFTNG